MVRIEASPLLSFRDVTLAFGGIIAINNLSFSVFPDETVSIVGPNGAGKTSIFNCINRFYRNQSGHITFADKSIDKAPPHRVAQLGIARSFQNVGLASLLTVVDSIMLGRHIHMHTNPLSAALFFPWARNEEVRHRHAVEAIIEFLELERVRFTPVHDLPFGTQKLVEIGRALALEPKLLLLDEPTSGMNREEKEDVARFIVRIRRERRIPILLIEHDLRFVAELSDRIIVVDFGKKIADGPPDIVLNDARVIEAYLG
jgi:branched-chain amino acid transport system ATP-binding protein